MHGESYYVLLHLYDLYNSLLVKLFFVKQFDTPLLHEIFIRAIISYNIFKLELSVCLDL